MFAYTVQQCIFQLALCVLLFESQSQAFVAVGPSPVCIHLHAINPHHIRRHDRADSSSESISGSVFDDRSEDARFSLETLFAKGEATDIRATLYHGDSGIDNRSYHNTLDSHVNAQTLLSSAARYRKGLELQLLESLKTSDDAIDELVHLWMYETGVQNGQVLESMEVTCSTGLIDEQAMLTDLVERYPLWVEPLVRLASLLFFKGQTLASYHAAEEAYTRKPYHFEIVPLLVMLCLRSDNLAAAIRWARRGLPTLRGTKKSFARRQEWVEAALEYAGEQLKQAEEESAHIRWQQEQQQLRIYSSSKNKASSSAWQ